MQPSDSRFGIILGIGMSIIRYKIWVANDLNDVFRAVPKASDV